MRLSYIIFLYENDKLKKLCFDFEKILPFDNFGYPVYDFHYTFVCKNIILQEFIEQLKCDLHEKLLCDLVEKKFNNTDPDTGKVQKFINQHTNQIIV
jgi:hypothetical protein